MEHTMKKFIKSAAALLLALVLSFSLAGCYDAELTWSAKKNDTELPVGAYIYYLSVAYNEAAAQIDTETEVLKGEIDGTPAATWITDRAKMYVNQYFWMQDELARLGLEMDDADYAQALQTTTNYWSYFGSALEEYGIAKTSFDIAYSQYNVAYLKVFEALYGEGGEREIPEADIRSHYTDNYYSYEYFIAPLTKTDADGNSADMTDEEKEELTERLEKFKADILDGDTTVSDASNTYALEIEEDASYQSGINDHDGMTSAYLPTVFIETLEGMAENDVEIFEASNYMVLLRRRPIADSVSETLEDEDSRLSLMIEMKNEEFQDYVREAAEAVEGVELNQKAISRYQPSMFTDTTKNGTSSTPEESSETSSEAESSEESE